VGARTQPRVERTQVSTRAAHLCAAGIATLVRRIDKPFVTIGVDGSVYRFHPAFKQLLDQKIYELLGDCELEVRGGVQLTVHTRVLCSTN
jgi:hexokinase